MTRFKNLQKPFVLFLTLSFFTGLLPLGLKASETRQPTRTIIDRAGRTVSIPQSPKRIACLFGSSYEKLFAFGGANRISIVSNVILPWNVQLNPGLKNIPVMGTSVSPDVEELLRLKTDLVIYHPFAKQIEHLEAAGLPVVVPYDGGQRQLTLENFIQDYYGQIRFYGEMLGGPARDLTEEYCTYVDERIKKVIAVTSEIPLTDRPRVFYFCGQVNGPAGTQTLNSTAYWLVAAAGGTMLTHDDPSYFVSVSTEQMLLWNPDIIVVSTLPSIDPILANPHWKRIKAVQEKRVFMSPEGQFYWSHFSTESFLCILFLAKLFHPQKFKDLDVTQELQDYYARFYHYSLTPIEAERILQHLPPVTNPKLDHNQLK